MAITQHYALVTGATSGIGLEFAKLLARDGFNLIITSRSQDTLTKTATKLKADFGVNVITLEKDLFNKNAAQEIYDIVKAKGLQIDILINNAGQGQYGEFITTDLQRDVQIIQLNIMALVTLTKLFLQDMVESKKGKILNLSSVSGSAPGPLQSVYHATRAFVQSFTEAVNNEVKDTGVTVTALLPAATATDFFRKANMLNAENIVEGDLADPADVAMYGYDALMKGNGKVISGFQNKIMAGITNLMPDSMAVAGVHNQQLPVEAK